MKKIKAFTLIELLVTIVIIGILATISMAQYKDFTEEAETAKTINALVEYQDLFERYYAINGTYPMPSSVDTWYCLADYGTVDRCYSYSSGAVTAEIFGDNQLRQTLVGEIDAEFDTSQYHLIDTVAESLLYLVPPGGQGYSMLFYVDIEDFDCTRLRGLNGHGSGTLISNGKNSWTAAGDGSSCFYAVKEGKPVDYFDLWN